MRVETPAEQMFFCTVRIKTTQKNGPGQIGTGFLFDYKLKNTQVDSIPFLITNRHVLDDADIVSCTFHTTLGNEPELGNVLTIDMNADWWISHPDKDIDLIAIPVNIYLNSVTLIRPRRFFLKTLSDDIIPTEIQLAALDALEEVTFIGYPQGLWDSVSFLPIARRGTTASPLDHDFEGKKAFLVDASVFPGSSGSPVFYHRSGSFSSREGGLTVGNRLYFLGVVTSVFRVTRTGDVVVEPAPTAKMFAQIDSEIGIGICVKAPLVIECLEHCGRAYLRK